MIDKDLTNIKFVDRYGTETVWLKKLGMDGKMEPVQLSHEVKQ